MTTVTERKSIFITGAASGMGRETARLFCAGGWFVGAYDVDYEGLQTLQESLGRDACLIRKLDVSDREDYREALTEFANATGGKLDLLFNNAGIGRAGFFDEQSFDDVMAVVNVNFVGVLNGIHLACDLLKATPVEAVLRDPDRLLGRHDSLRALVDSLEARRWPSGRYRGLLPPR